MRIKLAAWRKEVNAIIPVSGKGHSPKAAPATEAPASHNDAADDVLIPIEAPEPTPPLTKG